MQALRPPLRLQKLGPNAARHSDAYFRAATRDRICESSSWSTVLELDDSRRPVAWISPLTGSDRSKRLFANENSAVLLSWHSGLHVEHCCRSIQRSNKR